MGHFGKNDVLAEIAPSFAGVDICANLTRDKIVTPARKFWVFFAHLLIPKPSPLTANICKSQVIDNTVVYFL